LGKKVEGTLLVRSLFPLLASVLQDDLDIELEKWALSPAVTQMIASS
jgi:hypothetical protein